VITSADRKACRDDVEIEDDEDDGAIIISWFKVTSFITSDWLRAGSQKIRKNVIFWDIKIQFVPHRRHIKSSLQSPAS
jgi:hypothetical protein